MDPHDVLFTLFYGCLSFGTPPLLIAISLWTIRRDRRQRLGQLSDVLSSGALRREGTRSIVEGHRDGRAVRIEVDPGLGFGLGGGVEYALQLPAGHAPLALDDAADVRAFVRRALPPGGALRQEAMGAVEVLATAGVRFLRTKDGWLTASRGFSEQAVHESSALSIFDALAKLAGLLGRAQVQIKVAGVDEAAVAWAEGGRLLCPYCRDDLLTDDLALVRCPACDTAHHAECFADAGGCTVLGCRGAPERRTDAGVRA